MGGSRFMGGGPCLWGGPGLWGGPCLWQGVPVYEGGSLFMAGGPDLWGGVPVYGVTHRARSLTQIFLLGADLISKGDGHPPAGSSASRSGCSPGRLRGASMALRHRAPRSAPALPAPGPARRAGRERTAPVPPRSRLPPPGTRRLRKKSNTGPGGGAKMAPGTEGGRSGRECTGDGGHRGWGERAVGRIGGGEDGGWGGAAMGSAEDALGMGRTGKGSTGGLGRSGDGEKQGWGEPRLHREWGEPGPGMERDAALSYPRMLSREAPVLPCPAAPQLPALPPFRCRSRSVRGSSQLSRSPIPAGGRGGAGGTGGGGTGTRPATGREPRLGMRDPGDPGGVEGGAALEPCGVTGKYLGSCFLGGGGDAPPCPHGAVVGGESQHRYGGLGGVPL